MRKKRVKLSQKGISDLVSNIMIILLVIIIAAIIFSWGYNYFQQYQAQKEFESKNQLACAGVYFAVKEVCYTNSRVEITLENQASENILELIYRLKSEYDLFDWGVAAKSLGIYEIKKYLIGYVKPANVVPKSIELFPVISVEGRNVTCGNLIKAEDVKNCITGTVEASPEESCECTSDNLNGSSCSDFDNYEGGTLYCGDCSFVLTGCRKSSSGGGGGGGGGGGAVTITIACTDNDGDGYGIGADLSQCTASTTLSDCDDDNPGINPGVEEVIGNGIDENCMAEEPTPTCELPYNFIGDADGDCSVGGPDIDVVNAYIGGFSVTCVIIPDCSNMDLNGDGGIGGPDYDIMNTIIGGFSLGPGGIATPSALEVITSTPSQTTLKLTSEFGAPAAGISICVQNCTNPYSDSDITFDKVYSLTDGNGRVTFNYVINNPGEYVIPFRSLRSDFYGVSVPEISTTVSFSRS